MEQADFLVEPHFKGIVRCRLEWDLALLDRRNFWSEPLSDQDVVELLEECQSLELVTDVRRAVAAALYALDEHRKNGSHPRLTCPEGCPHRIGPYVFRGSQIMRELWRAHVPETEGELPPPIIDSYSDCTAREVERVLAHLSPGGTLIVVTDLYQRHRSYDLLSRMRSPGQVTVVKTPQEIQEGLSSNISGTQRQFLQGIVEAVEWRLQRKDVFSGEDTYEKERKDEKHYRKLSILSSMLKRVRPSFDLELTLAAFLRSDERLKKYLFWRDETPRPPTGGLPLRELENGEKSDFFAPVSEIS
ncbi:MAG: hypothetical protein PHI23_03000 [Candidatus Peribacteraceae bacterium]|nr:hypothetical protein [Candidatus Peribacteraceae bacterium]